MARRWLAALLLVPEEEREDVITQVELQINAEYGHLQTPPGQDHGDGGETGQQQGA